MKTSVIEQKDIAAARDSLKATRRWVGQELSTKLQIFHYWKQELTISLSLKYSFLFDQDQNNFFLLFIIHLHILTFFPFCNTELT